MIWLYIAASLAIGLWADAVSPLPAQSVWERVGFVILAAVAWPIVFVVLLFLLFC